MFNFRLIFVGFVARFSGEPSVVLVVRVACFDAAEIQSDSSRNRPGALQFMQV